MQETLESGPMLARLGTIVVSENGTLDTESWSAADRKSFNDCIVGHGVNLQDAYAAIKQRLRELTVSDTLYHAVYNQLLGRAG